MIKTIFFPILATKLSHPALDLACQLAREHDAHLVVAICINVVNPAAGLWSYYPMAIYETLDEEAKGVSLKLKDEVAAKLSGADVSHEVHVSESIWLTAGETAAMHARYYDLTVFARVPGFNARLEEECFADILMQSGRPLLLVPDGNTGSLAGNALIAWKPTREATRAVHDALPLLSGSKSVRVIAIDPKVGPHAHGGLPGADIAGSLAHHGLQVEVVECPRMDERTGMVILRQAQEFGAGWVVAGGYGHRRAGERIFGGVTRSLFEKARVPVLFSH